MKQLLFAGLFLSAITCGSKINTDHLTHDSPAVNTFEDSATIAGNWYLLPVLASDTAAGKFPQISFDLKTKRFSGNTGCNNMSGGFLIKQDALSFGENMISTKMACPGYNEKTFLDNLLKTNRYEIKNGVLQLMYDATILSKWTRQPDTTKTRQI